MGHAEINAILKAEKRLKDWRLDGCVMYVTLAPCDLCEKIIETARLDNVIYLLDKKESTPISKVRRTKDCNVLLADYQNLLNAFFEELRN